MQGRIGALHVHYRAAASTSIAAALTPALDRALQGGLGEAIGDRLEVILGDDPSVVVIRELTTTVRIRKADWSLDSRVVDRISHASADAVAFALGTPGPTDDVIRFADQAEFVGTFIVDLIDGSAWDRWYYGAFLRYRQTDPAATLEAVF